MSEIERMADQMVKEFEDAFEGGYAKNEWIDNIIRLSRLPRKTRNATTTLVDLIAQRVEAKYDWDDDEDGWIERTRQPAGDVNG